MKLEVHERLALLNILPKEGDYAALKTIRRNREGISFTPEEIAFYELVSQPNAAGTMQTTWNSTRAAEKVKDVPLDEYTTNVIRDKLQEMSKKHKLTDEYFSLFEKFVVMYQ
jgi:hypothetical protein